MRESLESLSHTHTIKTIIYKLLGIKMELITSSNEIKISSRDIASLTSKEHKNVCRDIKTQLGEIPSLKFEQSYLAENGQTYKEYVLPKNIALGIVSGYSFELRMKIINRLEQLESERKNLFSIPQTYSEALMLAAKQAEQIEEQKRIIEENKPLVSFAKSIEASIDSILISNYAKLLADTENVHIGQNRLFAWLRHEGYLMSGGERHNVPYQKYIDNGYFEVSTSTFASSSGTHQRFTSKITGKGQIALAKKIIEAFK